MFFFYGFICSVHSMWNGLPVLSVKNKNLEKLLNSFLYGCLCVPFLFYVFTYVVF